jgi:hypothetical protein
LRSPSPPRRVQTVWEAASLWSSPLLLPGWGCCGMIHAAMTFLKDPVRDQKKVVNFVWSKVFFVLKASTKTNAHMASRRCLPKNLIF